MKLISTVALAASLLLWPVRAKKEVFAHFIVGIAAPLEAADWENEITLAKEALIDGFVLNVGFNDTNNDKVLKLAFEAAEAKEFKLFFSFDYKVELPPAKVAWPKDEVIALLKAFTDRPAYFKVDGDKPLASTFEGHAAADDWPDIKTETNAFFVPDWSSQEPAKAVGLAGGVADGLFSFDAWPQGKTNITTESDLAFQKALGEDKVFMMGVAPWFFTNLPKYDKHWLWRGDNLWETRWRQILEVQPDFVEILTWNDLGESHYIGPMNENVTRAMLEYQQPPVDYWTGMTHDGWRKHLPFYIQQYKDGASSTAAADPEKIAEESVMAYYRTNPTSACNTGNITGNNPQYEERMRPEDLVDDSVFFTALLKKPADVEVSIGGKVGQHAVFTTRPEGGAGIYEGSVSFAGGTGDVVVTLKRGEEVVAKAKDGKPISANCKIMNWNAIAISSQVGNDGTVARNKEKYGTKTLVKKRYQAKVDR